MQHLPILLAILAPAPPAPVKETVLKGYRLAQENQKQELKHMHEKQEPTHQKSFHRNPKQY